MRKLVLIALLGVAALSGCASTAPGGAAPANSPATASAPSAPVQQPVTIPVASAKKVVLVMTGSKAVVEAKDWAAFKQEWRDTLSEYAKQDGIAFSIQDAAPPPGAEAGTVLAVYVNDYRWVGIGARIMLGIMSGNAYIDAKVNYRDFVVTNEAQFEQAHRRFAQGGSDPIVGVGFLQTWKLAPDIPLWAVFPLLALCLFPAQAWVRWKYR